MKKMLLAALLAGAASVAYADFATLQSERMVGYDKECTYNDMGREIVITVPRYKECQLRLTLKAR